MHTKLFDYTLPPELIAHRPIEPREHARLLVLEKEHTPNDLRECRIADFPDLLHPGDLLILNNTRVIPARVFGHKASGGKIEVLIERLQDGFSAWCHIRASKSPAPGTTLHMDGQATLTVKNRQDALFLVELTPDSLNPDVLTWLNRAGHMPLPPYIDRADDAQDRHDYQTVFAAHDGAVAAPTASLHLTENLLEQIAAKGVKTAFVTLHVGAGTFQPVRVDNIQEHTMHSEWLNVPEETVAAIDATRERGGRVVCVGTTALRAIETAARENPTAAAQRRIAPYQGDTRLFLYPGQPVHVTDALLTNFHLPQSTLLMLVSALAGRERILAAYDYAVRAGFRFFSYGDAMFIPVNQSIAPAGGEQSHAI
ncbi:tRNA preQ1(34) S-adenosylmethionine ribosyltransferase-isomerase QueA [Halothiobacillus neapolitanus]|jgi:S-adenosylmethionine:tRNA ribosyltransferase-isomerase|uniref:S-adenosylmethionine:tRNA ribosyltransferase-isomerase n=1 Tax=Halothiobacillus neapolitanus (strain ATCC 23641 / DSM 15147 / CIP 104769 / NCIMB 8539 / c2) TaxID=555778 RepID=D0KW94_HALNC|nr:tRNA preQ1(34) S-adenosylmethionine ribosyltransferase-isomerase QueA [Halothiobacillus neapolitanus]ACX96997.1 S-adenosylmethionine/tRNA-ribosyltransferase-isomerase [Halothiobacillus neapolitanus c2]OZB74709.1 MAG: tRNA preQ1(34) S-adenosylmethionine ribosyltransferase-isomerase QueA [Halothiobacillus sp. 14-55-98]TDN59785.1 S-adenosylmethionine:tRNA ribosyltransferase-isomerase [Halothiobacillus neapolitanus]